STRGGSSEDGARPMHIAIIGAGALGRIYGVRLAKSGDDVSFVVRSAHLADTGPIAIELVGGDYGPDVLEAPRRVDTPPPDADVIVLAVRFEHALGPELLDALSRTP